ncbi:MAG: amino acid ABC transporter permease [Thermaceae bacterium]|nr:amino acid ABC transporter permease [Thermaceae bacterium]
MLETLRNAAPFLLQALWTTLWLGVVSFALSLAVGLLVAVVRLYGPPILRLLAAAFVSVVRGTPLLTQILLVYYGLPQLGVTIEAIPAVILTLALHAGAYTSEDIRGGMQSVDRGQWEAGYTVGMSFAQVLRRIILPQAVQVITPSLGNRFITMIKDTSLASVVTVVELTRVAEQVGSATFRYIEMFVIVAIIYWGANSLLSVGQARLERHLRRAYQ